jgi:hypothetical protein
MRNYAVNATSGVVNGGHVVFGHITIRASQERDEGSIGIIHSSRSAPLDERRLAFSDISRTAAIATVHRAVSPRGANDSPPIRPPLFQVIWIGGKAALMLFLMSIGDSCDPAEQVAFARSSSLQ